MTNDQITDARRELERELAVRDRVYPRWVQQEKLTEATAERRISRLKNAIKVLRDTEVKAGQHTLFQD